MIRDKRIFDSNQINPLKVGAMVLVSGLEDAEYATTECADADTDYKITGVFEDGNNKGFLIDNLGKITFIGKSGTTTIVTGVSDLTANKVCQLHYTLYKNGEPVINAVTPCSINNPNKSKAISITRPCKCSYGDYLEVYVQSDTSNTVVTHFSLMLTFICDR